MKGPSPLLPAWLDFWLQPSRAAWSRGLKSGASPLLLPDASDLAAASPANHDSQQSADGRLQVRVLWLGASQLSVRMLWRAARRTQPDLQVLYFVGMQGLDRVFGDVLPQEGILQRSEFLLPLDDDMRSLYWNVLHP